jgi:hypothetical protein
MEERSGRKYRTESEWQEIISRWRASGQSAVKFSKSEGICLSLFHKWSHRIEGTVKESAGFLEVKPVNATCKSDFEIVCKNGRIIKVGGMSLSAVLHLVESI